MGAVLDNFLGIPEIGEPKAQVIVLPVPIEQTTSYGQGTKNGPAAIVKASQQVELFDPEWGRELQAVAKIKTVKPVESREQITDIAKRYDQKFLISLGGEHSITPELVRPFRKTYPNLSILQIDAHTDMRDEWEGTKDSHACAMRRVQEQGIETIVQVGIRNTAKEEQQYLNQENIFRGDEFDLDQVISKLSDNVYLSFDVDGLDVSIMPATGTPEPGGLSYRQALQLLRAVARQKNLVAADFVELAPIPNMPAYDFLVAKLIFKLIGYKYGKAD